MEQVHDPEAHSQKSRVSKEGTAQFESITVPFENVEQSRVEVRQTPKRTQTFFAVQEQVHIPNAPTLQREKQKQKYAARGAALAAEAMAFDVIDSELGWWTPVSRLLTSYITAPFIMGRYAQARRYIKESQPEVAATMSAPYFGLGMYLFQVNNGFSQYLWGDKYWRMPFTYLIDYGILKGIGVAIGLSNPAILISAIGVVASMYLLGRFMPPLLSEKMGNRILGFMNKTKETVKGVLEDTYNVVRYATRVVQRTKLGRALIPVYMPELKTK